MKNREMRIAEHSGHCLAISNALQQNRFQREGCDSARSAVVAADLASPELNQSVPAQVARMGYRIATASREKFHDQQFIDAVSQRRKRLAPTASCQKFLGWKRHHVCFSHAFSFADKLQCQHSTDPKCHSPTQRLRPSHRTERGQRNRLRCD
jgi:hypothetical protein